MSLLMRGHLVKLILGQGESCLVGAIHDKDDALGEGKRDEGGELDEWIKEKRRSILLRHPDSKRTKRTGWNPVHPDPTW